MLDKCNIGRTEIVCLCLALVGCIMAISPTGSAPAENKLEDCRPRKQNKPDPEDECEALPEQPAGNYDKFKYDVEPSLSYYSKFKYDLKCEGITCDYRHDCGRATLNTIRGDKFLPYIINGQPQRYGSWPSFATLKRSKPHGLHKNISLFGGVIISPRHILTCKYCLGFSNGTANTTPTNQYSVVVGDHTNVTDPHEKKYKLASWCKPKGYENYKSATESDWAVVTIDGTIEFDQFKQPACLPYKHDYDPPANKFIHCYLMGFGADHLSPQNLTWKEDPRKSRFQLQGKIFDMPVVAQPCRGPLRDSNNTMCFKKIDKPGTICEDLGSPVLCKNPRSNRWTVVGLVAGERRGCSKGQADWQFPVTNIATLLSSIKADCHI